MSTRRFEILLTLAIMLAANLPTWAGPMPEVAPPVPKEEMEKIEAAVPTKAAVVPKMKRKILVMWRCKYYHQAIPQANAAIELMGRKTGAYEAVFTNDGEAFTADNLQQYDGVFLNNTCTLESCVTPDQCQALVDFVNGGKGLIGNHGSTDSFKNWLKGGEALGGIMRGHPWGGGSTVRVLVEDRDHPINRAFQGRDFFIKDEIYQFVDFYSRENQRILLALDMYDQKTATGGRHMRRHDWDYAVSWIKRQGQGRVFYCSLGHNKEIYWNPAVMQHYLDGIQYALGDLTDLDDTPSASLYKATDVKQILPELLRAKTDTELAAAEREIGILVSRIVDKDQATAPLLDALPESRASTQQALLRLCARSSSPRALESLLGKLDSQDQELRRATISALSQCQDPKGAAALVQLASDTKHDAECSLALTALTKIITLTTAKELPELLEQALAAARSKDDRRTVLSMYVKAEDVASLRKVATLLDDDRYRDVAIEAILKLSNTWKLRTHGSKHVVDVCNQVIAVAPNDQIKATAQARIKAASKNLK